MCILTVLIVIALVRGVDLPPQAVVAAAAAAVGGGLLVPDGLGQGDPLGVVFGGVLELELSGDHGCHAPEGLVVVAERRRPVLVHEIPVRRRLVQQRLVDVVVPRVVVRDVPVVQQSTPHRSALPPVVVAVRRRAGKDTRDHSRLIAAVVRHHVLCDEFGRLLYRFCEKEDLC